MVLIEIIIKGLAFATVLGDIVLLMFILLILRRDFFPKAKKCLAKHKLLFSFIIASIATLGSLFFSEIAKFEPCKLCWIQRIFMYPMALILGLALIYKDKNIKRYIILLGIIGSLFSAYHYFTQMFAAPSFCSATEVSCTTKSIAMFGYVTIPMMALTAFLMIISLMMVKEKK